MKTTLDGEIPEYSLALRGKKSGGGGWWFAVLALLVAGGLGWLAFDQYDRAETLLKHLEGDRAQLAAADAKQKDLTAKLETAENERNALQAARDELSKDVQSKDEELAKLKGTYDQLQDKLKSELSSGDVRLSESGGKLRVDLVDKVLFDSGEAKISHRGENVLMRLGAILAGIPDRQIQVSGHTDKLPIGDKRSALFPTNWELSVARATNGVRVFEAEGKVPGGRMVGAGYGEFHPVASNKTAAGRARNRRIEILLTPSLAPHAIGTAKLKAKATATAEREPRHSRGK
jgi:chemotaxis protein MotB